MYRKNYNCDIHSLRVTPPTLSTTLQTHHDISAPPLLSFPLRPASSPVRPSPSPYPVTMQPISYHKCRWKYTPPHSTPRMPQTTPSSTCLKSAYNPRRNNVRPLPSMLLCGWLSLIAFLSCCCRCCCWVFLVRGRSWWWKVWCLAWTWVRWRGVRWRGVR
ncbi:hypothetical protein BDZ91DRAFT_431879 [Kalaharituber pfeilii]|nr:hypothetical protein BDZ91DRAFT_431879 [Kalaharituber pfeilii]